MNFEWDEKKRKSNLKKHGIDFRDVLQIFINPYLSWRDDCTDYGEAREIIIGSAGNIIIVAVTTDRQGNIRIISARKANKNERKKFKKIIKR